MNDAAYWVLVGVKPFGIVPRLHLRVTNEPGRFEPDEWDEKESRELAEIDIEENGGVL